jgi:3-hydroxyacyl-[acyl-carrier-protein] dehydratase
LVVRLLYVDRVVRLHRDQVVETLLDLSDQDDVFRYHFPGNPMLPASILIESFAQAGTIVLETSSGFTRKAFPGYIASARFPRPVRPSAPVRIRMEVRQLSEDGAVLGGEAWQEEKLCATCTIGMVMASLADFFPGEHLDTYRTLYRKWLAGATFEGFDVHPLEQLDHVRAR